MNYNQSCAAKGNNYGNAGRPSFIRSMQRASVNVYKTENSYVMLVFAPGRIKEHFQLNMTGNDLMISYTPPEGFPRPEWIQREYSRGGFKRTFAIDENIDTTQITAKYADGVLEVTLPLRAEKESPKTAITIQ
jgi:HSP20 family protein